MNSSITLSLREECSPEGSAASNASGESPVSDVSLQRELQSSLSRRLRRLGALGTLGRTGDCVRPVFRVFFASTAPPIFAYYACIRVVGLPDVIDAQLDEIDFLFARPEQHADLLVAAGLLACGASLGRIATRAAYETAREKYGAFAAWILLHAAPARAGAAPGLPDRDDAYAIGHCGYRVFAAQQQPAFDKWVDAVCAKPLRNILIGSSAACAAYREARVQFRGWEAIDAAHQG